MTAMIPRGRIITLLQHTIRLAILRTRKLTVIWRIGTEKLVSGEYKSDVFVFGNSDIRKLLADIQIEEQNHAEMLWKYKTANGMA